MDKLSSFSLAKLKVSSSSPRNNEVLLFIEDPDAEQPQSSAPYTLQHRPTTLCAHRVNWLTCLFFLLLKEVFRVAADVFTRQKKDDDPRNLLKAIASAHKQCMKGCTGRIEECQASLFR